MLWQEGSRGQHRARLSCSVSGRGIKARLSQRKVRPKNSAVPQQMLQGFARAALRRTRSRKGRGPASDRWPVELHVEIELVLPAQHVGEQMLGIQPGAFHRPCFSRYSVMAAVGTSRTVMMPATCRLGVFAGAVPCRW